ncbi:hypothetical protein [Sulfitobacter sp.]|uniref:hypothetical protein n=1 Tax=Sulfitobacter sp. TaxID=1903071 RepID=UPI00329968B1
MDIAAITQAIGLATTAVGATGKAADTINSIKGLFDGDKEPDTGEATRLLNTLAVELTTANMLNVQISAALKTLSQEMIQQDQFETEKARYEMFETRGGALVFRIREEMRNGQPSHYVCPVCLNRDKLFSYVTRGYSSYVCQTNRDHFFDFEE